MVLSRYGLKSLFDPSGPRRFFIWRPAHGSTKLQKTCNQPHLRGKTAPGLGSPRCTYQKWCLSMENSCIPWQPMVVIQSSFIAYPVPSSTATRLKPHLRQAFVQEIAHLRPNPGERWPLRGLFRNENGGFNMLSHG